MLDDVLRQHSLFVADSDVNVFDACGESRDSAGNERRSVIGGHRLRNRIGQRRHAHAATGGHYDCMSNHPIFSSSAGGLSMMSNISRSDKSSAPEEQKGPGSGSGTGSLNLITKCWTPLKWAIRVNGNSGSPTRYSWGRSPGRPSIFSHRPPLSRIQRSSISRISTAFI